MAGEDTPRRHPHAVDDPETIVEMVHQSIRNATRRRKLGGAGTPNPIDGCWRGDPNWADNRFRLADCAIGFGKDAKGGKGGKIYVVTDNGDADLVNPKPGTLRHAVLEDGPTWIVFEKDMTITLKGELIMTSFKTIDGRGADVHITGAGCVTVQDVTNIIIHGVSIHDCVPGGNTNIRSSWSHYGFRGVSDGDAISIFSSSHIWIDHNWLSNCKDGLVDVVEASTAVTISNNYFTKHNEVMLLGHSDGYLADRDMQVTIAFNHFGEGLVQRMPRCRLGYFHVVNNDYTHWGMYAIGGSANPTINSQGNRFTAPDARFFKKVTKENDAPESVYKTWNWRSEGDLMLNGAYFPTTGNQAANIYARASSLGARSCLQVPIITANAGALRCSPGTPC
ncbi:unnamed protein product [Cuscuta campestris]|uniref:Pectate lyase n=1 Tax=Cuscuta campestris TaxID=132261 RepID=A0A484NJS9_9ASTE|nr:unnamed protein product [Cuscuta campestris]